MSQHVVRLMAEVAEPAMSEEFAPEVVQHLSDVIDALEDIEETDDRVIECDLHGDLAAGCIEIAVVVDADDRLAASEVGIATVRAAIHAAGGATPGWEDLIRTRNIEIDPNTDQVDDEDCALV